MRTGLDRRTRWAVGLVGLAVVVLVVVGYLAFVPPPTASPDNEALYSSLSSAGIEDAFVDVTDDRVLVRYELPAGYDLETTNYLVLGAAAEAAPYTGHIVVEAYDDSTRLVRLTANTGDVLAVLSAEEPSAADWERLQANLEVEP